MIRYLCREGFLEAAEFKVAASLSVRPIRWKITVSGLNALSEFEECADQQAKRERQQAFQNKISVASVLIPAVTFVLGLLVEHFAGVVRLIASLVHG